ncbi:hypothetical protein LH51_12825 [Nitrincola sp. A-D6]|uniref:hypothetical protein n=1 Tax=Nitrincola sp. A-D6 TaxID=1545442 RepID=UPI00051FEC9A|nr:hypothetical protein [Nitrincola sp. A-D6]KGK41682.1 hypothetical protein LH51_12825 [Nitrincola sp. A-D6]
MVSTAQSAAVQLFSRRLTQRVELKLARMVAVVMLLIAGAFALILPGSLVDLMNQVIALVAATLFPATLLLILKPGLHPYAVLTGMLTGLISSVVYVFWFNQHLAHTGQVPAISLEAFGACAMLLNFGVSLLIAVFLQGVVSRIKE